MKKQIKDKAIQECLSLDEDRSPDLEYPAFFFQGQWYSVKEALANGFTEEMLSEMEIWDSE